MNLSKIISVISAVMICISCTACSAKDSGKSIGEMRDITSMELTSEMKLGWNLGNTLDVCAADRDGDGKVNEAPADGEKVDETLWGNAKATKQLFDSMKDDGVNLVRIPVTWRDHMGGAPDYKIDDDWMARVHEVVDYAIDNDMYVILNIHHDGGGDPKFGAWVIETAVNDYDAFIERYDAVWTQIADEFQDYSDHLIFESMNEVGFDKLGENDAYDLLNKINQHFVDLIRSTGGNNPKRHLLIAGYWTDIAKTCDSRYKMPEDPENRCILSVHYYTPWEFCVTNLQNTWGTDSDVRLLESKMNMLKTNFIDNGVPVIIGEYGTDGRNDRESRIKFNDTVVSTCHSMGIPCCIWDDGGVVDRTTGEWTTEGMLEGLQQAIG